MDLPFVCGVLVNGGSPLPCYRMSPSVRENCCSSLLDIVI
jgi:hypothetical protein